MGICVCVCVCVSLSIFALGLDVSVLLRPITRAKVSGLQSLTESDTRIFPYYVCISIASGIE